MSNQRRNGCLSVKGRLARSLFEHLETISTIEEGDESLAEETEEGNEWLPEATEELNELSPGATEENEMSLEATDEENEFSPEAIDEENEWLPEATDEENESSFEATDEENELLHKATGKPSSKTSSPLPELIIEREENRHDDSEEFYQELEVKMLKIYRSLFCSEHSDDRGAKVIDEDENEEVNINGEDLNNYYNNFSNDATINTSVDETTKDHLSGEISGDEISGDEISKEKYKDGKSSEGDIWDVSSIKDSTITEQTSNERMSRGFRDKNVTVDRIRDDSDVDEHDFDDLPHTSGLPGLTLRQAETIEDGSAEEEVTEVEEMRRVSMKLASNVSLLETMRISDKGSSLLSTPTQAAALSSASNEGVVNASNLSLLNEAPSSVHPSTIWSSYTGSSSRKRSWSTISVESSPKRSRNDVGVQVEETEADEWENLKHDFFRGGYKLYRFRL